MRLLVDKPLSPVLAEFLRNAGHEAVHVRDIGLHHAADEDVFERAAAEDIVVVTADTDFGTLLARRSTSKPALILFRGEAVSPRRRASSIAISNRRTSRCAPTAGRTAAPSPRARAVI